MNKLRQFIRETLTKSYDIKNVLNYLSKYTSGNEVYFVNDTLKVEITYNNHKHIGQIVKDLENLLGWYLVGVTGDLDEPFYADVEEIKNDIQYNADELAKEYGEEMDDMLILNFLPKYGHQVDVPDFVYHVTSGKKLEKILKQGLVCKSKSKKSYHPERIYLGTEINTLKYLYRDIDFDVSDPVVLKIDLRGIKEKMKFYEDPHFETGIYTTDNIPPNRIISYERP